MNPSRMMVLVGIYAVHSVACPGMLRANEMRVEIVQGVCPSQGKDEPIQHAVAKVSLTAEASQETGPSGRTAIPLPTDLKKGMPVTIVVLRDNELLDVIWPPEGNFAMPDVNNSKFVRLVVQPKGDSSGSAFCSEEVLNELAHSATESSLVQSSMGATLKPTPDIVSRITKQFDNSMDWFPVGLLAVKIEDWEGAVVAFQASRQYRIAEYQRNHGSQLAVADSAYLLGYSYFQMGRYAEAADAFEKADVYQADVPRTVASYAISLEQAVRDSQSQKKVYDAYIKALKVADDNAKGDRLFGARLRRDFGGYLINQGNYNEAKQQFQEAIDLQKDVPGQESELAEDYMEIARCLNLRDPSIENNLNRAIQLLEGGKPEGLARAQFRLGSYWTDFAYWIDADAAQKKADYEKAEKLLLAACPVSATPILHDLEEAACAASYAELRRYRHDCRGAIQRIQDLHEKSGEIAAKPGGADIAKKVEIIWKECSHQ